MSRCENCTHNDGAKCRVMATEVKKAEMLAEKNCFAHYEK